MQMTRCNLFLMLHINPVLLQSVHVQDSGKLLSFSFLQMLPFSVRFLYYYIYYFILFKPQNFIPSPYKRRIVKVCSYKLYFFSNRARTTTPSTSSATSIIPPAIFSSFWSSQHFAAGIINFCCSEIISPLYV